MIKEGLLAMKIFIKTIFLGEMLPITLSILIPTLIVGIFLLWREFVKQNNSEEKKQ